MARSRTPFRGRLAQAVVGLSFLFGLWSLGAQAGGDRPARKTDGLGLTLVLVPAGEFLMGASDQLDVFHKRFWHSSPPQIDQDLATEKPQHRVRISAPFYMSAEEITVAQFRQFVRATGYVTDAEKGGHSGRGFDIHADGNRTSGRFETSPKYNWKNPGFPQGDDHPVVLVSWNDAVAFCAWLSRQEKVTYRLPTEAEWEYACRAGTDTWLSFGDDPSIAHLHANLADVSLEKAQPGHVARQQLMDVTKEPADGYAYTAPVGRFKPNGFGLFDMHGNAWEWCADRYQRSSYANLSPTTITMDPKGPASRDDDGELRVLRGGSWYVNVVTARSSSRLWNDPADSFCYAGFRVVREP